MALPEPDYCTCSPDRLFGVVLKPACKAHDEAYARAATLDRWSHRVIARMEADVRFRADLKRLAGDNARASFAADVYFVAVRLFGGIAMRVPSPAAVRAGAKAQRRRIVGAVVKAPHTL